MDSNGGWEVKIDMAPVAVSTTPDVALKATIMEATTLPVVLWV